MRLRKIAIALSVLLGLSGVATGLVHAQSISVQNPSFETATLPITGNGSYCNLIVGFTFTATGGTLANWLGASTTPSAAAGAFDPSSGGRNWTSPWWTGNDVAYLQTSAAGTVSLSQTLSTVLQHETTYTLSALVGRRTYTPRFNYAIQLWAGSTMLASASNLALANNSSGTDSLSYSSGSNNAEAGQALLIVLSSTGANGTVTEAFFDDIALSGSNGVLVSGSVSAGAFGGFTSVSPGSWIEIYGSNLASDTRGWTGSDFNGVNAPTSLDGTSVTIGGQAAFIDYISPGQVNAQVPSNVGTGLQQLTLKTDAGTSSPLNIAVNAVQPGLLAPPLFSLNGIQYAVALFFDGTYVLPEGAIAGVSSHPAKPGNTIILYGVGFGPVTPDISAGEIVQESNTLASKLEVSIGGMQAMANYSGLAPNYVGLYQFNIVVPNVAASNAVPLTFTLGGVGGTQTLYIAVQN